MRKQMFVFGTLLCFFFGFAAFTQAAPITEGLIAAYEFDGNADDSSGNGYTGTVYGATLTTDRFGNAGSAYDFDGNDYIQTNVNSNSTPITISLWFNLDSLTGEQSIVDSDVSGHYGHSLILGYIEQDGDLDVQYHNGYLDNNITITTGEWYHAVIIYSDTIQLYLNGTLAMESTFSDYNTASYDGTDFRFGRHNAGDPQWFDGQIDDAYFYNRALTADDIQTLYTYNPVPVPGTLLLMGAGILGITGFRRRGKN